MQRCEGPSQQPTAMIEGRATPWVAQLQGHAAVRAELEVDAAARREDPPGYCRSFESPTENSKHKGHWELGNECGCPSMEGIIPKRKPMKGLAWKVSGRG